MFDKIIDFIGEILAIFLMIGLLGMVFFVKGAERLIFGKEKI